MGQGIVAKTKGFEKTTTLGFGMRRDMSPPFHELEWQRFQRLCCDMFEKEEVISASAPYRVGGQSQFGIDIIAYRKDDDGIEVGQCKCYAEFPPSKIKITSDHYRPVVC